MGLHGVSQFLRNKVPHLRHTSHISLFAHQRVFVDIASYLFKYVVVCGTETTSWLNQFMSLMYCFRKNGVIVIPVFDGPAPAAKHDEQQARRDARNKTKEKIEEAFQAIHHYEMYRSTRTVEDVEQHQAIIEIIQRELSTMTSKGFSSKPLMVRNDTDANALAFTEKELNDLKQHLQQQKRSVSTLSKDDYELLQHLLQACGITYIKAPGESEAYCCYLVRHKFGAAVVSYDTDCIAHRADTIIFDLDKTSGQITYVNTEELCHEWGLTEQQLVDFGILVGCDYNPGCRKNKIGPVKAVQLLAKYGTIENIPDLADYEGLKAQLCRELFNIEHDLSSIVVPTYVPDEQRIRELASSRTGINLRTLYDIAQCCTKIHTVKISEEK